MATMWHKERIYFNARANGQTFICPRDGKVTWKLSKPRFLPPPEDSGGTLLKMPIKNKRHYNWSELNSSDNKKRRLNNHKDALLDLWQPSHGPAVGFTASHFDIQDVLEDMGMGVEIPPPPLTCNF